MPLLLRFIIRKEAASSPIFGGTDVAGVVAGRNFLDLDDLGAHVGEHQRAGRACHDMRQVDNLQSTQRAHCFSRDLVVLGAYSPVHCGWRLFRKASMPSRKSWL